MNRKKGTGPEGSAVAASTPQVAPVSSTVVVESGKRKHQDRASKPEKTPKDKHPEGGNENSDDDDEFIRMKKPKLHPSGKEEAEVEAKAKISKASKPKKADKLEKPEKTSKSQDSKEEKPYKEKSLKEKSHKEKPQKEKSYKEKSYKEKPSEEQREEPSADGPTKSRKALKREQIAELRTPTDPHYQTVSECKRLWELSRSKKCSSRDRKEFAARIVGKLLEKDALRHVCTKHDCSRMLQTCVRYGRAEDRTKVARGLAGSTVDICSSMYGKHVVTALLEECPGMAAILSKDAQGHVLKLVKNAHSAPVLNALFTKHLDRQGQARLISEFYGHEFLLFSGKEGGEACTLEQIVTRTPAKRSVIMGRIRQVLDSVLLKEHLHHSIIHRLILDYVQWEDKARVAEFLVELCPVLPEVAASPDGARAAIQVLALAPTKERKLIIKAIQVCNPFLLAKGEHAHRLFLAAVSLIDDTKAVQKSLVEPFLEASPVSTLGAGIVAPPRAILASSAAAPHDPIQSIIKNTNSRRCLLALLGGLQPFYVPAETLAMFEEARQLSTGKKDAGKRVQELRAMVLAPTIKFCLDNWTDVVKNSFLNGIIVECLVAPKGENGEAGQDVGCEDLIKQLSQRLVDEFTAMLNSSNEEEEQRKESQNGNNNSNTNNGNGSNQILNLTRKVLKRGALVEELRAKLGTNERVKARLAGTPEGVLILSVLTPAS